MTDKCIYLRRTPHDFYKCMPFKSIEERKKKGWISIWKGNLI